MTKQVLSFANIGVVFGYGIAVDNLRGVYNAFKFLPAHTNVKDQLWHSQSPLTKIRIHGATQ